MAVHVLKTTQKIPANIKQTWQFFSRPDNLKYLTPPDLNMVITNASENNETYRGEIITYKITPIAGIRLNWVTEITHVEEEKCFTDEQRTGPYRMWHHEHHFKIIEGGVEMTDIVSYKLPLGFAGRWLNKLLIRKKLKEIFTYRYQRIEGVFGQWNGKPGNIKIVFS